MVSMGTDYYDTPKSGSTSRPCTKDTPRSSPLTPYPRSSSPQHSISSLAPSPIQYLGHSSNNGGDSISTMMSEFRGLKSSQTSFHPGGKGLEFLGTPSGRAIEDEVSWGTATFDTFQPIKSFGKQVRKVLG